MTVDINEGSSGGAVGNDVVTAKDVDVVIEEGVVLEDTRFCIDLILQSQHARTQAVELGSSTAQSQSDSQAVRVLLCPQRPKLTVLINSCYVRASLLSMG